MTPIKMSNKLCLSVLLFACVGTICSAQVPTTGLVAWYSFNGNANDQSVTANHATVHGAVLTTDRNNNSNKAYSFNGSSDRLEAPDNAAHDFGAGDFSITSWVSLSTIAVGRIASAGYTANDGIWGLGFGSLPAYWGSGLRINYFVYSGDAYHDFNSTEITGYSVGQWCFVGVTKTGSTLTFYFNGQQAGTATIPFVSNANSYLSIGSRQLTSGSQIEFLDGKIDEVRIYKRSLTSIEILRLYDAELNGQPVFAGTASRKAHGSAGTFDLALASTPLDPATEPRSGGAGGDHTLVFAFDRPLASGVANVTAGVGAAGTPTFAGNEMLVPLSGVSNAQYVTVGVSAVGSTDGGSGGSGSVRVGFLLGDVSQNRAVTLSDLGQVNAQIAQFVTSANYLKDVNASGTLSLTDKGITNTQITKVLPAP